VFAQHEPRVFEITNAASPKGCIDEQVCFIVIPQCCSSRINAQIVDLYEA
jgi:hypothetical protein